MRVWRSRGGARRSLWRPPPPRAASIQYSAVVGRPAVAPSPWSPSYGQRSASSRAPTLRDWAADREDVRFRFRCTQCGRCCTGRGGRVRVNERELREIAVATRESEERVRAKYVRPSESGGWLLRQSADDAHCVFLDGNKCSIYEARPTQCRTYPWWPHHLISDYDWRVAAKECEGISADSTVDGSSYMGPADDTPAYSFDEIAPQVIAHDIHRSGENYTHEEMMELLDELLGSDPSFVDEFKDEFFAKFSRAVVFQDEELAVLDTTLGGEQAPPTRCFVFKNRLQLVQSEVNLNRQSGGIDRSHLTLEVHRAMCIPFIWLPQTKDKVTVAVLGAGAAALPLFLLHHLPQVAHIDAVEPNARVVAVSHEYFGVREFLEREPEKLVLHEQFGEDFLRERVQARAGGYDLVIIDVDSGESLDDIAAPPSGMLSPEFLGDIKQQLTRSTGVAVFNVIALSPDALGRVSVRLRAAFPHGIVVQLKHTKNAVFYLFNNDGSDVDSRKAQLTSRHLAQDPFQADTAQTAELIASAAKVVDQW